MLEGLGFAMALQFKPDGNGGWLYRKDQTGAPLPATAAERDSYVRWFGWITLSSLPLFMVAMIAMAFVFDRSFPNPTNSQSILLTIPMVIIVFGITYGYVKYLSHAPARAFADRAPVGAATTIKQVHGNKLKGLTYPKIALNTVGLLALTGLATITADLPPSDLPAAFAIALGIPLVIGVGFAIWKWRIDTGRI